MGYESIDSNNAGYCRASCLRLFWASPPSKGLYDWWNDEVVLTEVERPLI
jgi:hypothetical protein